MEALKPRGRCGVDDLAGGASAEAIKVQLADALLPMS